MYMNLLGIFLLFMFLGVFFPPFFGGCFFLIAFFIFLTIIVIFFSLNFFWFLLIGLGIYGYMYLVKYNKWKKLPDLQQYMTKNPECKLDGGVCCNHCQSTQTSQQGLFSQNSKLRFYTCKQCGSTLFRFKVL